MYIVGIAPIRIQGSDWVLTINLINRTVKRGGFMTKSDSIKSDCVMFGLV